MPACRPSLLRRPSLPSSGAWAQCHNASIVAHSQSPSLAKAGEAAAGRQCRHPALREERKPEYSEKYDSVPSRMRSSCAAWLGLTSSMPCGMEDNRGVRGG